MAAGMAADGADAGQRSFRTALHAVADALTAHGFAAHTEQRGNQLRIVNNHCPFGAAAIEHPVICAVDRGMVKGMLAALYGDTEPELAASLPQGDQVCVTEFEPVLTAGPAARGPPLPRPRLHLTAAPGGRRGHDGVAAPGRWPAIPPASTPRATPARVAIEDGPRPGRGAARRPAPRGGVHQRRHRGDRRTPSSAPTERGDHVVVPAIEHSAVRLASERHDVTVVGCDRARPRRRPTR